MALQKAAFQAVDRGEYKGILFTLEHTPVYTFGASGGAENLLVSRESLKAQGIDLVSIRRGGNITYHGPGQLILYPVLKLEGSKRDLRRYVGSLEESVIRTLADYGILGGRKSAFRGAWVGNRKIAAVGVRIKRWITLHGLALNIAVDKSAFYRMNPCGITEFGVCSLEDFLPHPSLAEVRRRLIENFEAVFDFTLVPLENPWEDVEEVEVLDIS